MAGFGRVSDSPDPERYEEVSVTIDVVVVGAGIAGLSAALAAAAAGARVMVLAAGTRLGGASGWQADPLAQNLVSRAQGAGIEILTRTMAFGVYDQNLLCARQQLGTDCLAPDAAPELRERLWKIRSRTVIAATGAFERPMVFPDNDRPGVMLAGAAEKFAAAYGVACGSRAVIAANCDRAYATAEYLRSAGVEIAAIADIVRKVRFTLTAIPAAASMSSMNPASRRSAACVHSQAGGKLRWMEEASMFVPDGAAPGLVSVGACAGVFLQQGAVDHAAEVGDAVARRTTAPAAPIGGAGISVANSHHPESRGKQFVDLQNDVTADDVALAARENYRSVEHLKRYTTTGMGTDQGKTSNVNALVLLGSHTGRAAPEVGTTKFRPPFAPVTFGVLAGRRVSRRYRPLKMLPGQGWHEAHGAVFDEYGGWWRPAAYPVAGESIEAAAIREATATRQHAGLFDGSPLGKMEVFGPDAARFLDLMYVGTMSTLPIGRARYGLLLNENGIVVDDGIVARLGGNRFWVNTTSGGAERVAAAFDEWLQCEYADLKVLVTPVTSRWANVTVAGPQAWDWLQAAGFESGFAPRNFPHMSIRDGRWGGLAVRVLRASFSGELGFELNLPVNHAEAALQRLWALAPRFEAVPYGIEALQIMRIEKGYIHIGTDTDGTTLPQDIGFARAIDRKASDFVGRRSLLLPNASDAQRMQLVGLVPADSRTPLPVGAHIASSPPPTLTEGHVTSSAFSPMLGHPIALAMLVRGGARVGERVRVHHLGSIVDATVVKPPLFDRTGERLHG